MAPFNGVVSSALFTVNVFLINSWTIHRFTECGVISELTELLWLRQQVKYSIPLAGLSSSSSLGVVFAFSVADSTPLIPK